MTTERESAPGPAGEEEAVIPQAELDAAAEGAPEAGEPTAEASGLERRVASLEAQLDLAQEKARETFAKLKEEHELRLRAAADLDNYRKRAVREREDVQKFGVEKVLKDLLPVVDNLDRALASAPADDPLADGVKMVRKIFQEALGRHGVEVFSAIGKPFDPRLHEALAQLEAPDAEPGSVVAEHGRGFLLHGRLLRPALVAVAAPRATPKADEPAAAEAGGGDDQSERGAGGPQAPRDD